MTSVNEKINVLPLGRDIIVKIENFFRTDDGSPLNMDVAETVLARLRASYATSVPEAVVVPVLSPSIEECLDWSIPRVSPLERSA